MRTSQMTTGKDYNLNSDTILLIDESIYIGEIFTGNQALTICGSSDATLNVTRIASGSSTANKKTIALESGNVNVTASMTDRDSAVYTSNVLEIRGGKMKIEFSSANTVRPVAGINADTFHMSGGELNIVSNSENSTSSHGIRISGKDPSSVSGGTITVTSDKYGLTLYQNTRFSVTGGTMQFFGGRSTSDGYGIYCYYASYSVRLGQRSNSVQWGRNTQLTHSSRTPQGAATLFHASWLIPVFTSP